MLKQIENTKGMEERAQTKKFGESKLMNTDWNEKWPPYHQESSEIISIQDLSDQVEPVLAKSDLQFSRKVDNLRVVRLREKVTKLRQVQQSLRKYVEKEVQASIEAMRHQFMTLYRQSVEINTQNQSQLLRKEVQINQLTRQKQELSQNISPEQERYKMMKSIAQQRCNKCEELGSRLIQQQKEKRSIQQENEKLQESIFDLQQQVVGVQLQVQRRLKANPFSEEKITDWMRKFQQETQRLQARCQHYENICVQQEQLETMKKRLKNQEADLKTKEDALIQSLTKLHAQQEHNYLRQHQVTLAEQDMNRKIAQLRRKEAELIQWQAKLSESKMSSPISESPEQTSIPKLIVNKPKQYQPTQHRQYERYDRRSRQRREYVRLASPIRKETAKMTSRNGASIYRQTNIGKQKGGRGLGPKLQRLRYELKRQIESIY